VSSASAKRVTSALNPRSGFGDVGREAHSTSATAGVATPSAEVVVVAAPAAPVGGASLFEVPAAVATFDESTAAVEPTVESVALLLAAPPTAPATAAAGPLVEPGDEDTVPRASCHRQLVPAVWPSVRCTHQGAPFADSQPLGQKCPPVRTRHTSPCDFFLKERLATPKKKQSTQDSRIRSAQKTKKNN